MFSVMERKTHISQTAGFGRTPVTLSLIIYSLFNILFLWALQLIIIASRNKEKRWEGRGTDRRGNSDSKKLCEKDRPELIGKY